MNPAGVALRRPGALLGSVRAASRQTKRDDLKLFKEINELARSGVWCSINNAPLRYQFADTTRAYNAYYKLAKSFKLGAPKHWHQKYSWGSEANAALKVVSFVIGLELFCLAYDYFVPQEYRYKWRKVEAELRAHAHHEEHHEDGHGHH